MATSCWQFYPLRNNLHPGQSEEPLMKITFHGAARTVTGSQHLIEVNGLRILLDCGFYQGKRSESRERNTHFPFDPASIDIMVLSHAHIDHSGNIPVSYTHLRAH